AGDFARVQYTDFAGNLIAQFGYGGRGDLVGDLVNEPVVDPRWVYSFVPDLAVGGDDTLYGNGGEDILIGGAGNDAIDGGAGDDVVQADASIDYRPGTSLGCVSGTVGFASATYLVWNFADLVGACRDAAIPAGPTGTPAVPTGTLHVNASYDDYGLRTGTDPQRAGADGSDYIEGGDGSDVLFGNQGQDDIVGGNSDMFSLDAKVKRHDAPNLIF